MKFRFLQLNYFTGIVHRESHTALRKGQADVETASVQSHLSISVHTAWLWTLLSFTLYLIGSHSLLTNTFLSRI